MCPPPAAGSQAVSPLRNGNSARVAQGGVGKKSRESSGSSRCAITARPPCGNNASIRAATTRHPFFAWSSPTENVDVAAGQVPRRGEDAERVERDGLGDETAARPVIGEHRLQLGQVPIRDDRDAA